MEDNYTNTNQKVKDFFKGFFLNIGIGAVHFGLYCLLFWIISALRIADSMAVTLVISILLVILIVVVEFILIRHFFRTKRYVAIGMLSSLLLPLLVTGYCSVVFNAISQEIYAPLVLRTYSLPLVEFISNPKTLKFSFGTLH
jgi:type IV secretory pathway VirB6-like protein